MRVILLVLHFLAAGCGIGWHLLLAVGHLPPASRSRVGASIAALEERCHAAGFLLFHLQALTGLILAWIHSHDLTSALPPGTKHPELYAMQPIAYVITLIFAIPHSGDPLAMLRLGEPPSFASHLFDSLLLIALVFLARDFINVAI